MAATPPSRMSWGDFPGEIRLMIFESILHSGSNLAACATVSREWQKMIEPHNFANIRLTPSRLADFDPMTHRNQNFIQYIWLCLELEPYNCDFCSWWAPEDSGLSDTDHHMVLKGLENLFSSLSTWRPKDRLLLDISVYSPSDSEHFFKYLTFEPDTTISEEDRLRERRIVSRPNDSQHHWIDGAQHERLEWDSPIEVIFDQIWNVRSFPTEEEEHEWFRRLPEVTAVTGVLLRSQTRRRWKPASLAEMLRRMPNLQEIHYEPWREWGYTPQSYTDGQYQILFDSFGGSVFKNLKKLVIFENFNQQYPSAFHYPDNAPIRVPSPVASQAVAKASLGLESLSASYIADASYFFRACNTSSWSWPHLTSLVLTSHLLNSYPSASPVKINNMLQEAATVAMRMPNLDTLEIWYGIKDVASLFRYQSFGSSKPALISFKGTWDFTLQPSVVQAWVKVIQKRYSIGSIEVEEVVDKDIPIRSHGDAIQYLKIQNPVIRPTSLRQIQMEHKFRASVW